MAAQARDLEELLEQLHHAADADYRRVSVDEVLHKVGTRSFSPLLLLVGACITSPLSGIPGFPTVASALLLLISVQLLAGRRHFWLPRWLLRRSVPRDRMLPAIDWLQPGARFIDRFLRPRLTPLVGRAGSFLIAMVCLTIAFVMPLLEFIPFSSSVAGISLLSFGLALVSCDGVFALLGYATTALMVAMVVVGLP